MEGHRSRLDGWKVPIAAFRCARAIDFGRMRTRTILYRRGSRGGRVSLFERPPYMDGPRAEELQPIRPVAFHKFPQDKELPHSRCFV